MSNIKQKFLLFLLGNLLLWSLIPLLRHSLSMDTQEAIVWGKYCLLGTTKHPPLSGLIAYGFWHLFAHVDGVMYLLSQIFVALGVVYIYRLARCFLEETKAVLAALLQFGIIYYNFSSVEFNVNVISLALWPMCAFYFWRGYTTNKWSDWLLFGVFTGLNLLNKYVGGLLLIALGVFVLTRPKLLRNSRLYTSGLVCLAVAAPHMWWLWQNDFTPFNYLLHRSSGGKIVSAWRHLFYPLKFFGAQVLFAAAALLTYGVFWRKNTKEKFSGTRDKSIFLLLVGFLPLAIWLVMSLLSGHALKSMWGFPCLFAVGIMLFYFLPFQCENYQERRFFKVMAMWTALFAFAYGTQCILTTSQRYQTDARKVAAMFEQKWAEHTEKPLKYTGSDVWFGDIMALYASHEIKPMIWFEPKVNPWFDQSDFEKSGALLIATSEGEYAQYRQMYGAAVSAPQTLTLEFKNYFGKTATKDILFGFYEPWEVSDAAEK